jgi:hypothetical protein
MAKNAPHAPFGSTVLEVIEFHSLPPNPRGCRLWRAAKTLEGYPKLRYHDKMYTATRVLLEAKLGRALRPGMEACHTCDVPSCCTEAHLFEGSRKDNQADMARKGRSLKGERHHMAKLTNGDVRQIRALLASGMRRSEVAKQFGVSWGMINFIHRRKNWTHVS